MHRKASFVFLVISFWVVCTGAGTGGKEAFDAETLPPAFPGMDKADDANLVSDLERKLPPHMSVVRHGHFVIAASGSMEETIRQARHIAEFEAQMRERSFPDLETRRTMVILGENASALHQIARMLYPALSVSELPASGFYHPKDRLILVTTADGNSAIMRQLMHALVQDDNPDAPGWFEQAAATLYESSEWRAGRLTPTLDQRMEQIAPEEDLSYDVFAGVCDCSPVSSEQLALMRLLLIFLDQRNELGSLHSTVKGQGQYTTLLQVLQAMGFDRTGWKEFAERSVRTYSR